MKNWKKASIAALCVAALLAGCGTQDGDTNNNDKNADEPKEISLEQVRADNIPEKLLEKYDAVTVNIQGTDRDGEVAYTAKIAVHATGATARSCMCLALQLYRQQRPVGEETSQPAVERGVWQPVSPRSMDERRVTASLNMLSRFRARGRELSSLTYCPQCADPAAENAEETHRRAAASRTARCCSRPPRRFDDQDGLLLSPPSTTPIP